MFKEERKEPRQFKGQHKGREFLGIGGSYSSILAVVKLVIPKTKVTGHTRLDFPFLQGQVDNADLIYFIL